MKRFDKFIQMSVALFVYWINRCDKTGLVNNKYLSDVVIDKFLIISDTITDWNYTTARMKVKQVQKEREHKPQILATV